MPRALSLSLPCVYRAIKAAISVCLAVGVITRVAFIKGPSATFKNIKMPYRTGPAITGLYYTMSAIFPAWGMSLPAAP